MKQDSKKVSKYIDITDYMYIGVEVHEEAVRYASDW